MSGYQVSPGKLHTAGAAAIQIGNNVIQLAAQVASASQLPPAPAGLGIGATLTAVAPLWQRHLTAVGTDVRTTGELLCSSSANYSANEDTTSRSFQSIVA